MTKEKRVVVIGGGTGVFTVLSGLRKFPLKLYAIVSMADDGGSTGRLREEFGALPPGDIRRALVALSSTDDRLLSRLFTYRFSQGKGLKGHSFGNLFLTALEKLTGDFRVAVKEAAKILEAQGEVIPVTLSHTHLFAQLENRRVIKGETNIDIPKHNPRLAITRVWLAPRAVPNRDALEAILRASLIVMGPGDLYTSIIPNLLVSGIPGAIRKSRAKKVYVVNVMTKYGETTNFKASDFISEIETYLGRGILDVVVLNTKRPERARLLRYAREGAQYVVPNLVERNHTPKIVRGDFIRHRGFIRHDPHKLAKFLYKLA